MSAEGSKVEMTSLAQARGYMLGLHHQYTDQACWQDAAELMSAAKNGNTKAAAESFHRALVITLLLWKGPWIKLKRR